MSLGNKGIIHQGLSLSAAASSSLPWSLPIHQVRYSEESGGRCFSALGLADPGKFAAAASQARKGKTRLAQYLVKMTAGYSLKLALLDALH